jgi:hypothetical protein
LFSSRVIDRFRFCLKRPFTGLNPASCIIQPG